MSQGCKFWGKLLLCYSWQWLEIGKIAASLSGTHLIVEKGNQCNNAKHFSCHSPFVSEFIYLPLAHLCRFRCCWTLLQPGFGFFVSGSASQNWKVHPCPGRILAEREGAAPSKAVLTEMEVLPSLSLAFHTKGGKMILFPQLWLISYFSLLSAFPHEADCKCCLFWQRTGLLWAR